MYIWNCQVEYADTEEWMKMHSENIQDKTRKMLTTKESCRRKRNSRSLSAEDFCKEEKSSRKFVVLQDKSLANENNLENLLFIDCLQIRIN